MESIVKTLLDLTMNEIQEGMQVKPIWEVLYYPNLYGPLPWKIHAVDSTLVTVKASNGTLTSWYPRNLQWALP